MREYSEDFAIQNGILKKYRGNGGHVVIPDGVTSIGDDAFYGCNVTIHTPEGSYAESYARKNRIHFVAVN